jgi:hypothetical protein
MYSSNHLGQRKQHKYDPALVDFIFQHSRPLRLVRLFYLYFWLSSSPLISHCYCLPYSAITPIQFLKNFFITVFLVLRTVQDGMRGQSESVRPSPRFWCSSIKWEDIRYICTLMRSRIRSNLNVMEKIVVGFSRQEGLVKV